MPLASAALGLDCGGGSTVAYSLADYRNVTNGPHRILERLLGWSYCDYNGDIAHTQCGTIPWSRESRCNYSKFLGIVWHFGRVSIDVPS